jgi:hypothetical protein
MVSKATLCLLFLACGVIGAAWADEADGIAGQMRRHLIEGEAGGVSQGERDVSV